MSFKLAYIFEHHINLQSSERSLDSPDDLPIVVILDLFLMARVHRISRLVGLEETRLLLDGVGLHHNVMLHKLRLVPSLRCKRNNISYLSRLQKQAQEIGSDLKVVYILYQKSNMFENINSIEGVIKWKTCLTLVKLTSISSSESLSSSSAASTKLETFFFSFSCKEHEAESTKI